MVYTIPPKRYRHRLDLLIHKDLHDYQPHRLRWILLVDIESNMHNNNLERNSMQKSEDLEGLSTEKYGIRSARSAAIQILNIRLLYDLIRLKSIPYTRFFVVLIPNYNLVLHRIAYLSLQRVDIQEEPILCILTTIRTSYTWLEHNLETIPPSTVGKSGNSPQKPNPRALDKEI